MKIKRLLISSLGLIAVACNQPNSSNSTGAGSSTTASSSTGVSTATATTTTTTSSTTTINALQIITKADPTGSFDAANVPLAGGASVKAARIFNLDGSLITTGNIPTWFSEARVFLTSTRT